MKKRGAVPAGAGFPNIGKIAGLFSKHWKTCLGAALLLAATVAAAPAAVPVPMAGQPGLAYTETFADIANWAADFSSGSGANRFGALPAGGAGTIPSATKITVASTNWTTSSTAGKQKGSGTLVFLVNGSTDNSGSVAVDFFADYSGVDAGTLGFDWAGVINSTGDRKSSLRVYWSTDGAAFAELAAAQVLNVQNGVAASGSVAGVALPAAFNNNPGAQLRFYVHNGVGGTTGNRPKISLDNLALTATGGDGRYPTITLTDPLPGTLGVGFGTSNLTLTGRCNTNAAGHLRWTNSLTGVAGLIAAATNWSVPALRLGVGTNRIVVRATNTAGAAAASQVVVTRDMREFFTIMTANLTDRDPNDQMRYIETSARIFKALRPDIVAIQEWLVTNASRRAYVDAVFGPDYDYAVESSGSALPNGVISRWPITANGYWADTQVSGRNFEWTTINLPGTQDLHVISVHFKSGATTTDEATRKKEAIIITNQIRKAGWPATDFIVVGGDFNTPNRNDDCLLALSNVFSDAHQPADQAGDKDTNLTRGAPYDYVLPCRRLDACHVPFTLAGITFPDGMVFDSRVWAVPPPPVQTNDSAGTDMQHLAVIKQFALLTCTDCDDDAMLDTWELANFGNLTMAGWGTDFDTDGFRDAHEYRAGTQPTNAASALALRDAAGSGAAAAGVVRWDSVAGKRYRLLRTTNAMEGFAAVRTGITAIPPLNVYTDLPPESPVVLYGIGLDP